MTDTLAPDHASDPELTAADVAWELEPLLGEHRSVDELLDKADAIADELAQHRGRIASLDAAELASFFHRMAELHDLVGRAGSYAGLRFSVDTNDPANGALLARVEERSTAISTKLIFVELEWAAADDAHVDEVLADPALDFVRHHLRSVRRYRDHLLTEPEERILNEKSVTGTSAWGRLFSELVSAI
ncbi:MAG TPA: oligoendopeptidase, partial [Acidimicrobiales bacterium]